VHASYTGVQACQHPGQCVFGVLVCCCFVCRRHEHSGAVNTRAACGSRVTVFDAWDAVVLAHAMPPTSTRTYLPMPTPMPTPTNITTPTRGRLSPRPRQGHAQASWQHPRPFTYTHILLTVSGTATLPPTGTAALRTGLPPGPQQPDAVLP
jgi:hypothetical protein